MTDNIVAFDFKGIKVLVDSNTRLVRLVSAGTAENTSWHDSFTNANYQVPSSKKFRIIYLEDADFGGAGLASTTAVDSATGAAVIMSAGVAGLENTIMFSSSVAQNLFITTNGGQLNGASIVWGVEEAA